MAGSTATANVPVYHKQGATHFISMHCS